MLEHFLFVFVGLDEIGKKCEAVGLEPFETLFVEVVGSLVTGSLGLLLNDSIIFFANLENRINLVLVDHRVHIVIDAVELLVESLVFRSRYLLFQTLILAYHCLL